METKSIVCSTWSTFDHRLSGIPLSLLLSGHCCSTDVVDDRGERDRRRLSVSDFEERRTGEAAAAARGYPADFRPRRFQRMALRWSVRSDGSASKYDDPGAPQVFGSRKAGATTPICRGKIAVDRVDVDGIRSGFCFSRDVTHVAGRNRKLYTHYVICYIISDSVCENPELFMSILWLCPFKRESDFDSGLSRRDPAARRCFR